MTTTLRSYFPRLDLKIQSTIGSTPLIYAAENGFAEAAGALSETGADPYKEKFAETQPWPLHFKTTE